MYHWQHVTKSETASCMYNCTYATISLYLFAYLAPISDDTVPFKHSREDTEKGTSGVQDEPRSEYRCSLHPGCKTTLRCVLLVNVQTATHKWMLKRQF